jgi:hypothetical protein
MMKKIFSLLSLVLLLILVACGNDTNQSTDQSKNTETKKQEEPKEYTAKDVINKLKEAGLSIDKTVEFTEETDVNELLGRPGQYIAKANFSVKELEENGNPDMDIEQGGSVEIFANEKDAKNRFDYISEVTKSSPMLSEYDYIHGKMILRLSNKVLPSKAKEYQKAFESLN